MNNRKIYWLLIGVIFAILWSSASTATKFGLAVAQPLVIAIGRFGLAAAIMLIYTHIINKKRLPIGKEWLYISCYGLLNISIYLGLYVFAMQEVTAGIGALAVATNPIFISFMSVIFLKHKLSKPLIFALLICSFGVILASYPLFDGASVTAKGLIFLLISMLSYSAGAIYFSRIKWNNLDLITINGWQTLIGGLILLPITLSLYKNSDNYFGFEYWASISSLAILVSIIAVQLWLFLLKNNTVSAGLWLFLCPIFGFIIAAIFTNEPISKYTIVGVLLVFIGLYLSKYSAKTIKK